jgi:hypothetical protein
MRIPRRRKSRACCAAPASVAAGLYRAAARHDGGADAAVPVLPLRSADPDALAECAEEIIEKLADARAP